MKNLLVHLRLIQNKERDDDIEELIGYCLPWDLSRDVIEHIRAYASLKEISMWDALEILTHNGDIKLEAEYAECLCAHIEIVKRFSEKSQARDVVNKLQRIQEQFSEEDEEYDEEEEQSESFERQVNKWNRYTVEEVLQEVKRHIPIVEDVEKYEEKYNPFILTTCDHAKSQDFDTVFIIGADHIKQRERLYVNISRAKKRLILVTNDELSLDFLKGVPKSLYRFDYL